MSISQFLNKEIIHKCRAGFPNRPRPMGASSQGGARLSLNCNFCKFLVNFNQTRARKNYWTQGRQNTKSSHAQMLQDIVINCEYLSLTNHRMYSNFLQTSKVSQWNITNSYSYETTNYSYSSLEYLMNTSSEGQCHISNISYCVRNTINSCIQ